MNFPKVFPAATQVGIHTTFIHPATDLQTSLHFDVVSSAFTSGKLEIALNASAVIMSVLNAWTFRSLKGITRKF